MAIYNNSILDNAINLIFMMVNNLSKKDKKASKPYDNG